MDPIRPEKFYSKFQWLNFEKIKKIVSIFFDFWNSKYKGKSIIIENITQNKQNGPTSSIGTVYLEASIGWYSLPRSKYGT